MKSKMLLALAGLLIVSMVVISPVSAKKVIYRASGTLDEYNPASTNPTVLWDWIVVGTWSIKINKDGGVHFRAWYLEVNGPDNEIDIPGTLDLFIIVLKEVTSGPIISGDNCEFVGNLVFYKFGHDLATGKPKLYILDFPNARIVTDDSGIWIYLPTVQAVWTIGGSTLSIHY